MEKFLKENKHNIIIPLYDDTAEIISKNKESFRTLTKMAIPDYDILIQANDKNLTMTVARKLNIPYSRTME